MAPRRSGRTLMAAERPEPGPGPGPEPEPGPDPDESLVSLYRWLDTVPLSRPRKNLARDFSDGVLVAEVVKFFFPSLVELHSFVPSCSTAQKVANWGHLNRKVLSKLQLRLPEDQISALVRSQPGAAERLLRLLRERIRERERRGRRGQPPAAPAAPDYLDTGRPELRGDSGSGTGQEGTARPVLVPGPVRVPDPPDPRALLAERDRALELARDSIQVLQAKVGRLEQLLLLKNLRIDDLSRRLQQRR